MSIPYKELHERLQEEVEQFDLLYRSLEAEHQALTGNDLEGLEAAVADKEARVARVQECGEARTRFLQEAGFAPEADGMAAALEQAPPELQEELQQAWHAVRERLQQCQRQNEVNGRVVREGMRFSRQALYLLVGGDMPGSELYGRDGATHGDAATRSYAKV